MKIDDVDRLSSKQFDQLFEFLLENDRDEVKAQIQELMRSSSSFYVETEGSRFVEKEDICDWSF